MIGDARVMRQEAPWPLDLERLVIETVYRPGWVIRLLDDHDRGQGSRGLTLDIITCGYNSYHPELGENYKVHHFFIVPAASYNRQSWQRWLLNRCFEVEQHEACEFFVVDGEHVYAPNHGPGNDPYIVFDYSDDERRRTSFRGTITYGPSHPLPPYISAVRKTPPNPEPCPPARSQD